MTRTTSNAMALPSSRGEDIGRQVRGSANAGEREPIAGFVCTEGLCLARHPSGAIVAHAADAEAAARRLRDGQRDRDRRRHREKCLPLARRCLSSASATLPGAEVPRSPSRRQPVQHQRSKATIEYAIRQPYRPWHAQRRFSREARGFAPYRRPDAAPPAGTAASTPVATGTAASTEAETTPAQPASREPAAEGPEPQ